VARRATAFRQLPAGIGIAGNRGRRDQHAGKAQDGDGRFHCEPPALIRPDQADDYFARVPFPH
jgi:hypothetical protein